MSSVQNVDYVIVIPGNNFSTSFITSFLDTVQYISSTGKTCFYSFKYLPLISTVRNRLIGSNLLGDIQEGSADLQTSGFSNIPFAGTIKPSKVIMFDSDICWTINDFKCLVENDNDITYGAYWMISTNTTSVLGMDGNLITKEFFNSQKDPFEVSGGGLGFTAVKFEVFEKMAYPWFEVKEGLSPEDLLSEDFYFAQKAAALGYKMVCDPAIRPGHIKQSKLYI